MNFRVIPHCFASFSSDDVRSQLKIKFPFGVYYYDDTLTRIRANYAIADPRMLIAL